MANWRWNRMKQLFTIMLLLQISLSAMAQTVTANFKQTSMSEALLEIERQCKGCRINFIYDELQDFTITQNIKNQPVFESLRLIVGFYPIRIKRQDDFYYVECVQKETTKVTARIIDEKGKPLPLVNVALLSPKDSSYINSGVSNNNGDVVIPCGKKSFLARISCVGYKTIYKQCKDDKLGTIRMSEAVIALHPVKVEVAVPEKNVSEDNMPERKKLTHCQILKRVPGSQDVILEHMRYILKDEPYIMQDQITCINALGVEQSFTPDSLLAYYLNDVLFQSLTYSYNGQTRKGFLEQCHSDEESGLKLFAHYDEQKRITYYVQKGFETTVYPANDDPATGYVSPLHSYLTDLAGVKASTFEPFIDGRNMTPEKFLQIKRIIKTGNAGKFARIKYGATVSIENSNVNIPQYVFEPLTKIAAGIFADIPLNNEISLHPELTVSKYGHKGMHYYYRELSSATFNTTVISIPLMLRYSYRYLRGKCTPYVQIGYQPTITLSGKMAYRYITNDQKPPNSEIDHRTYLRKVEGENMIQKRYGNFTGGIGMEYSLTSKHSICFDIRGRFLPTEYGNKCLMATFSFNL